MCIMRDLYIFIFLGKRVGRVSGRHYNNICVHSTPLIPVDYATKTTTTTIHNNLRLWTPWET